MKRSKRKKMQEQIREIQLNHFQNLSRKEQKILNRAISQFKKHKSFGNPHSKVKWVDYIRPKYFMNLLVEVVSRIFF